MPIILLIPRLVRLLYPAVWVEDDFYLESAWLVRAGMRPYIDFVHPHLPLLEWIAAGYLKVFGASHYSIEILNEAAIYATSVLTFKLGARVASRRAAICAAILYATSSLVFRYHVYERECFVAPLVLLAAIAALDGAAPRHRRLALQALAIIVASAIKLTALIPAAVIVVFIASVQHRMRYAIALAGATATGLAAIVTFCFLLYGAPFLFQTFLFHLLKGRTGLVSVMTYPLQILDIQFAMLVIGLIAIALGRRVGAALMLVLAMLAAEYTFFGILSPTAWGHNYLEVLPFIAVIGGIGADWLLGHGEVAVGRAEGDRGAAALRLVGCGLLILVCLLWISPLVNENWLQDSVYGFGFVPREEISILATALRSATRPDENVVAPSFICFQANRPELIRFPETYGVWREAAAEYQQRGLAQARANLGGQNFFALIVQTAHFWRDPIIKSIRDGRVTSVIPDSPIQLLPLVIPPLLMPPDFAQTMFDSGLRPALETQHFVLWSKPPPGTR